MWASRQNSASRERELRMPRQIAIVLVSGLLLAGAMVLPLARGYPFVFGVQVAPNPATQGDTITITAYVNATDGNVTAAEFHFDDPNPTGGTGFPMAAQDGAFDEPGEIAIGYHDTTNLSVGTHTVCVLARETSSNGSQSWSDCNPSSEETFVINSSSGNLPPVADAGGPFYYGTTGVPVQFNGNGSYDPDGYIVTYSWAFGDGNTGSGVMPTHTYTAPGIYTVTLTVTDNGGLTDADTASANITGGGGPQLPVADAGGPYIGLVGSPVQFDGSASFDPDGSIVDYSWTFGDGNTGSGAMPSHTYTGPGVYTITLTVWDNQNLTDADTTSATIVAVPAAPFADAGGPYSGQVGSPVAFDGTGSYDLDGTVVSYSWDFGDGTFGTGPTPSHTYLLGGTYTVTLTVTDDDNLTGSDSANATIADAAPGAALMRHALLAGAGLQDVLLRWIASPDDGAGEFDVVRYEIHFGTVYSASGTGYALLATVPAGSTQYTHGSAGAANPQSFFYQLRAVDRGGQTTAAADQAGKFARALGAGKQLISVPLEQEDWSVGTVLQTLAWTRARTYVNPAGQGKNWISNDKQKPWADLTALDRKMAVWVELTAPGLFAVAGLVPASTTLMLKTGWNFIGYASFTPRTVAQVLAGISYQTVEGYGVNPPHFLQRLGGTAAMSAGNGYWVHVSNDAVLTLGN